MPEYQQPFSNGVSWLFLMLFNAFQEDGDLGIELVDLIYQEEDLFVFLVNIHDRQAFEASLTNPS